MENKFNNKMAKSKFIEMVYKIIKINRRNKMLKEKIVKFLLAV